MKLLKKYYKIILIILFPLILQCIFYFSTKLFVTDPIYIGSKLDFKIPYISHFVYFYILWYFMLAIVPLILYKYDLEVLKKYTITAIISFFISFIIFAVYPTTILRTNIYTNTISDELVKLIYKLDTPNINCLPSIHCLMCYLFITASLITKQIPKYLKTIIITLSLLIVASTLFIHQHVLYDVLVALILSTSVYLVVSKFKLYRLLDKFLEKENI